MTDPSEPNHPKSRRAKAREPQTIDLSATIIHEDNPPNHDAASPDNDQNHTLSGGTEAAPLQNDDAEHSTKFATEPSESDLTTSKISSLGKKIAYISLALGLVGGAASATALFALYPEGNEISAALEKRIATLESQLKTNASSPATPSAEKLATIENSLRNATERLATLGKEQEALKKEIQIVTDKVENLAQVAIAAGNTAKAASGDFAGKISNLDQHFNQTLADVQTMAATLRNQIEQERQTTFGVLRNRIETLETQTAALAKQAVDPLPSVRYVLINQLAKAVATGKPFVATLNSVRKAGVPEAELAPLAVLASSGAPTAEQLRAEFKNVAQTMVAYERSQSGEGLSDRLLRISERVVKITPRGTPGANDVASVTMKIDSALALENYAEAAQLWNALPDVARQNSASWGKRLNERTNADMALSKLADKSVNSLENSVR